MIRWGVLGATSTVARLAVLPALVAHSGSEVVATASLSASSPPLLSLQPNFPPTDSDGRVLEVAADALSGTTHYRRYEDLLSAGSLDAVYVPLPNSMHRQWVCAALDAGLHVLCEKPLAMRAQDAKEMALCARRNDRVLAEAYMTPYHPRSRSIAQLVASGELGELREVRTRFDALLTQPGDYRWNAAMGGGALLDLGVYCLAPILSAAKRAPRRVAAAAKLTEGPGAVDSSMGAWLDFGEGVVGSLHCSMEAPGAQTLEIVGTQATLRCDGAFTPGLAESTFVLQRRGSEPRVLRSEAANPYSGMVERFCAAVEKGADLEHDIEDSVRLAEITDAILADAGLPVAVGGL